MIENAFGMLKLKFQSLQNLPVQVNTLTDMDKVASWIMACVVLHNLERKDVQGELLDLPALQRMAIEQTAAAAAAARENIVIMGPGDNGEIVEDQNGFNQDVNGAIAKAKRNAIKDWVLRNRDKVVR